MNEYMQVGPILLCSETIDRSFLDKIEYPYGLEQTFSTIADDSNSSFFEDLEKFKSSYLTPRINWIKGGRIRFKYRYIVTPAINDTNQFDLFIFFHSSFDAGQYRSYWKSRSSPNA